LNCTFVFSRDLSLVDKAHSDIIVLLAL